MNTNMFDGVPDQFHRFIAATTSSLPFHSSFPLNNASPTLPNITAHTFPAFDPYHLPLQQPNLLHHPLPPPSPPHRHQQDRQDNTMTRTSVNLEIGTETQSTVLIDPCWTHDEVLALFRIRSSIETCFSGLTWEHVSRKLAELGFKRSADKCKERFEEESRSLNNINYYENYCLISEFNQELYQGEGDHQDPEAEVGTKDKSIQQLEKPGEGQDKTSSGHTLEEGSARHETSAPTITKRDVMEKSKDRKRKKQDGKFEMFKGFCEGIVNRMMTQQEEMHNKLLADMLQRDLEKFAREEAWKKQELDRMNKELEMMAREQALEGNRQATVMEFLKRLAATSPKVTNDSDSQNLHFSVEINNGNNLEPPPSSTMKPTNHQDTSTTSVALPVACPSAAAAAEENPSLSHTQEALQVSQNPGWADSVPTCKASSSSDRKGDVGRRWRREEVLALINLRCRLNSNNNEDKEGIKVPLWERISQAMSNMGYKRSAKRCKEKWENINKYFRKTKDINKERSLDSRTCPYFHLLATLHSQEQLLPDQSELLTPESHRVSPPDHPQIPPQPQDHPSHHVTQCT